MLASTPGRECVGISLLEGLIHKVIKTVVHVKMKLQKIRVPNESNDYMTPQHHCFYGTFSMSVNRFVEALTLFHNSVPSKIFVFDAFSTL